MSSYVLNKKEKYKYYYSNKNFLATSLLRKRGIKKRLKNYWYKDLKNILKYNTLIIDGEGIEKHKIKRYQKNKTCMRKNSNDTYQNNKIFLPTIINFFQIKTDQ